MRPRNVLASLIVAFSWVFGVGAGAITFPIPSGTPTSIDLQSPQFLNLDQPTGYDIQFSGVLSAPGVIAVSSTVTFIAPAVAASDFVAGLLVLTSLRNIPAPQIGCPLDEATRVPMEIDAGSFSGLDGPPLFVGDATGAGTICDSEGEVLLGLRFDTDQNTPRQFSFDLLFNPADIDLATLDLQILNEGFAEVPEPHTSALLLVGLSALGLRRRPQQRVDG